MPKRVIEEMAVGGLTGLAVVLVYIIVRAHLEGAQPGDWLQFSGALIGSAAAVAGALFVEHVRRLHSEKQGTASMAEALSELLYAFESAAEPLEGDLGRAVSQINVRRQLLEVAKEFTDFVLVRHTQPRSEVWRRTRGYGHYIDRMMAVVWYEHDPHAGDDLCSVESVASWHKEIVKITDSAIPIVKDDLAKAQSLVKVQQD